MSVLKSWIGRKTDETNRLWLFLPSRESWSWSKLMYQYEAVLLLTYTQSEEMASENTAKPPLPMQLKINTMPSLYTSRSPVTPSHSSPSKAHWLFSPSSCVLMAQYSVKGQKSLSLVKILHMWNAHLQNRTEQSPALCQCEWNMNIKMTFLQGKGKTKNHWALLGEDKANRSSTVRDKNDGKDVTCVFILPCWLAGKRQRSKE